MFKMKHRTCFNFTRLCSCLLFNANQQFYFDRICNNHL